MGSRESLLRSLWITGLETALSFSNAHCSSNAYRWSDGVDEETKRSIGATFSRAKYRIGYQKLHGDRVVCTLIYLLYGEFFGEQSRGVNITH